MNIMGLSTLGPVQRHGKGIDTVWIKYSWWMLDVCAGNI